MKGFWASLVNFLSIADNSLKGEVNGQELFRALFLALASGGGVVTILTTFLASAHIFITDPSLLKAIQDAITNVENKDYISLVVVLATFAFDVWRRYNHGVIPAVK